MTPRLRFPSSQPSARWSPRSLHGDWTLTGWGAGFPWGKVFPSWSEWRRFSDGSPGATEKTRVLEKEAHCTRGRSEPLSSLQIPGWAERWCLFLSPEGRAAGQVIFPPVSQSVEHSRPLILHYSPLLWSGLGELSDERHWSHSWGAVLRVFICFSSHLLPLPLKLRAFNWGEKQHNDA